MPGVVALAVAAPYRQAVIKRKHKKRPEQKDKMAKSDNLRVGMTQLALNTRFFYPKVFLLSWRKEKTF